VTAKLVFGEDLSPHWFISSSLNFSIQHIKVYKVQKTNQRRCMVGTILLAKNLSMVTRMVLVVEVAMFLQILQQSDFLTQTERTTVTPPPGPAPPPLNCLQGRSRRTSTTLTIPRAEQILWSLGSGGRSVIDGGSCFSLHHISACKVQKTNQHMDNTILQKTYS
jgi:hypothetical protein